jgi:hypothetical protein
MLMSFTDFKNKTLLESMRKLKLIKQVLKLAKIKSNLVSDKSNNYIYVFSTEKNSDIKGVIIYPIGNKVAFRVKNSKDGLPQGKPRLLDFEKIYSEIYSNYERNKKLKDLEIKSASKVVDDFIDTIKSFFKNESLEKTSKEKAVGLTLGTDYSSMVYSKY